MMFFGPHVNREHAKRRGRPSITAHIEAARKTAHDAGFEVGAVQVFLTNPHRRAINLRPEEAVELKEFTDSAGVQVYAHGSYTDYPWSGKPEPREFIAEELKVCASAGVRGLVIHLGRPGIRAVVQNIPRPNESWGDAVLFLETPHLKPPCPQYSTPEGLAELFDALVEEFGTRVRHFGICIDTAHLWSCGVDIRDRKSAENWLERLEAHTDVLPPERQLIHLNDSRVELGAGSDVHAPLAEGEIWGGFAGIPKESGLAAFVEYAVRRRVPVILERRPAAKLLDDYRVLDQIVCCE